jgi:hypothetical protein
MKKAEFGGKGKARRAVMVLLLLFAVSCSPKVVPVTGSTDTNVHVKDSLVINIKDSIRITEATHYKDMAWLGDSLKIEGNHSRMWAVADTNKGAIIGGLEEDKVEEKTRIEYRDRIQYRDSIQIKETPIPYPVEVIKKVVPWWAKVLSVIGGISLVCAAFYLLLRFVIHKIK